MAVAVCRRAAPDFAVLAVCKPADHLTLGGCFMSRCHLYEATEHELLPERADTPILQCHGTADGSIAAALAVQVIPTPSHLLDHISPIFSPFFLVFCAFSPPRRDGSNEPQAGTQGQETAGKGTKRGELPPSFDTPDAVGRIT